MIFVPCAGYVSITVGWKCGSESWPWEVHMTSLKIKMNRTNKMNLRLHKIFGGMFMKLMEVLPLRVWEASMKTTPLKK
jgi:hypothetical protein